MSGFSSDKHCYPIALIDVIQFVTSIQFKFKVINEFSQNQKTFNKLESKSLKSALFKNCS